MVALLAAVGVALAVSYLSKKGSDEKPKGLPFLCVHKYVIPPLLSPFHSLIYCSLVQVHLHQNLKRVQLRSCHKIKLPTR